MSLLLNEIKNAQIQKGKKLTFLLNELRNTIDKVKDARDPLKLKEHKESKAKLERQLKKKCNEYCNTDNFLDDQSSKKL